VSWIILFGTALAFICFNTGLARLKPAEASVTATVEPLAAVVFSYLLFDMTFGAVEMVGVIMIIGAISVLAVKDFIHKGDD
jgi:drug/metabolite transporter (DMT)-like permease